MTSHDVLNLLACPSCAGSLSGKNDALHCSACHLTFPAIGRVPWLYRDPEAKIAEWQNLYNLTLNDFRQTEERLKVASRQPGLSELTKKRLSKDLQARVEHRKALEKLLQPLGERDIAAIELLRVLAGKSASTQVLTSYAVNAIRDWGWPESDENARAFALVKGALGDATFESMAVLGAGAGRLAYDLHQAKIATTTVTLDINPFLTLAAERMFSGKSLVLQEFPLSPDGLDHVAVARKLSAPAKAESGLHVFFGDVLNAPFAAGVFDLVVTPWLIDILPEGPSTFAARLNRLLKPGGTWLNHGSYAFQQGAPERHISREELLEMVAATGFKVGKTSLDRVPYLSSPVSCQARFETVLTFAAEKVADVAVPSPYRSLPRWLEDPTQPLPRPERLAQLQGTHAFHAEVLGLIDGQKNATTVADLLGQKYGIDPKELGHSVTAFLASMYELAR